jgi:hypothetical protein
MLDLLVPRFEIKRLVMRASLIMALFATGFIGLNDQSRLKRHLPLPIGIRLVLFLVHDGGAGKLTARAMTGLALNAGEINVLTGDMALIALGILFFLLV